MLAHTDTIVALITGASQAAVATLRVSGPDAWSVASKVFDPWPSDPTPRLAVYGKFAHGDDGIALPFEEGHSYTGEQTVELSCHGSPASVRALLEACLSSGARLARPGEFTERAFLNGRLDLTQAQAVADTVAAQTSAQLKVANLQREGSLRKAVEDALRRCREILALVEATIDFSEEIGMLDPEALGDDLYDVGTIVEDIILSRASSQVRSGVRIALVGRPNAGKSSLLNALVGYERSIVTAIPGTTRDTLEANLEIGGVHCTFIDTAGLRESENLVEQLGVERSYRAVETADQIWYVFDVSSGWTAEDENLHERLPPSQIAVANKADLGDAGGPGVRVSALTRAGLSDLILKASRQMPDFTTAEYSLTDNMLLHLDEASKYLQQARQTVEHRRSPDLIAVELRAAINELGKVTGETATADMLDQIFKDFCIGK